MKLAVVIAAVLLPLVAHAQEGLVIKPSEYSVSETINRLEAHAVEKGLTVFARVDHGKAAKEAGLSLRDSQVLIFGSPKLGTPLMEDTSTIALDLPLKVLAWQDKFGKVQVTYLSPTALAERHGMTTENTSIQKMAGALDTLTTQATGHNN